jgi:ABC-type sugar transport system substrate-binding protein
VAQSPSEMGRIAVESALHALRSEPVPPEATVRIELVTKGK